MRDVLEITVTWGTQILEVHHLQRGAAFTFAGTPIELAEGSFEVGGATIDVASVRSAAKTSRGLFRWFVSGTAAAIALSSIGHLAVVATMASTAPSPEEEDGIRREQLLAMHVLLERAAEHDDAEMFEEPRGAEPPFSREEIYEEERSLWGPPRLHEGPRVSEGEVTSTGKLPVEVIQRIARQNVGRWRKCYETALRNHPRLEGTVVANIVIGRDGAVKHVIDGGSDIPNEEVAACVVRTFKDLSFPAPEAGIVTVRYPISFEAG